MIGAPFSFVVRPNSSGGNMTLNNNIPVWVEALSGQNFLAVYDVVLDIRESAQLSDKVIIPLLQSVVKFSGLMPGDGINMRDRYCEFRWNATGLLKKNGIIKDFKLFQGSHRWDGRLNVFLDKKAFLEFAELMEREYERRAKPQKILDKSNQIACTDTPITALEQLRHLLLRFHTVVIQLRQRHQARPTLDVSDEYDVQDLLHALLCLHFDDIRPEEWTPSYAGKSSRVDFFLKPEEIVLEVKKTRQGLSAKEIGDQLIIDIERYKKMQGCKTLVCMVYDPENRITNPGGLQADLSGTKEGLLVELLVIPKQY